jgi:hypothetical protein
MAAEAAFFRAQEARRAARSDEYRLYLEAALEGFRQFDDTLGLGQGSTACSNSAMASAFAGDFPKLCLPRRTRSITGFAGCSFRRSEYTTSSSSCA